MLRMPGCMFFKLNLNIRIMNITIREAEPRDAKQIARIITMAFHPDLCENMSGGNGTDVIFDLMQRLALREDSQYSYRNTLVCEVDGDVAGGACGYDGKDLKRLREALFADLREHGLPVPDGLTEETEEGEFYIDSLAVFLEYRGHGIASELIGAMVRRAAERGIRATGLLVDTDNPLAERLYLRLGFERVGVKPFLGHTMYHMQKTTKGV